MNLYAVLGLSQDLWIKPILYRGFLERMPGKAVFVCLLLCTVKFLSILLLSAGNQEGCSRFGANSPGNSNSATRGPPRFRISGQ